MHNPPTIWLNRPREDSIAFANELGAQGLNTIIAPVLHIMRQPLPEPITIGKPAAFLITSRHATHALAQLPVSWQPLPAYCVGSATAASATEHGLKNIIPGTRNVLGLLPHIVADLASGSELLYLAGDETRTDVVPILGAQNIHVTTAIVYRAVSERVLNDQIRSAIADRKISAVAFFSPRSAEIACKLMKQSGVADSAAAHMHAYCLSHNVAQAARMVPWAGIHTCPVPTRQAMRELIVSREGKKG